MAHGRKSGRSVPVGSTKKSMSKTTIFDQYLTTATDKQSDRSPAPTQEAKMGSGGSQNSATPAATTSSKASANPAPTTCPKSPAALVAATAPITSAKPDAPAASKTKKTSRAPTPAAAPAPTAKTAAQDIEDKKAAVERRIKELLAANALPSKRKSGTSTATEKREKHVAVVSTKEFSKTGRATHDSDDDGEHAGKMPRQSILASKSVAKHKNSTKALRIPQKQQAKFKLPNQPSSIRSQSPAVASTPANAVSAASSTTNTITQRKRSLSLPQEERLHYNPYTQAYAPKSKQRFVANRPSGIVSESMSTPAAEGRQAFVASKINDATGLSLTATYAAAATTTSQTALTVPQKQLPKFNPIIQASAVAVKPSVISKKENTAPPATVSNRSNSPKPTLSVPQKELRRFSPALDAQAKFVQQKLINSIPYTNTQAVEQTVQGGKCVPHTPQKETRSTTVLMTDVFNANTSTPTKSTYASTMTGLTQGISPPPAAPSPPVVTKVHAMTNGPGSAPCSQFESGPPVAFQQQITRKPTTNQIKALASSEIQREPYMPESDLARYIKTGDFRDVAEMCECLAYAFAGDMKYYRHILDLQNNFAEAILEQSSDGVDAQFAVNIPRYLGLCKILGVHIDHLTKHVRKIGSNQGSIAVVWPNDTTMHVQFGVELWEAKRKIKRALEQAENRKRNIARCTSLTYGRSFMNRRNGQVMEEEALRSQAKVTFFNEALATGSGMKTEVEYTAEVRSYVFDLFDYLKAKVSQATDSATVQCLFHEAERSLKTTEKTLLDQHAVSAGLPWKIFPTPPGPPTDPHGQHNLPGSSEELDFNVAIGNKADDYVEDMRIEKPCSHWMPNNVCSAVGRLYGMTELTPVHAIALKQITDSMWMRRKYQVNSGIFGVDPPLNFDYGHDAAYEHTTVYVPAALYNEYMANPDVLSEKKKARHRYSPYDSNAPVLVQPDTGEKIPFERLQAECDRTELFFKVALPYQRRRAQQTVNRATAYMDSIRKASAFLRSEHLDEKAPSSVVDADAEEEVTRHAELIHQIRHEVDNTEAFKYAKQNLRLTLKQPAMLPAGLIPPITIVGKALYSYGDIGDSGGAFVAQDEPLQILALRGHMWRVWNSHGRICSIPASHVIMQKTSYTTKAKIRKSCSAIVSIFDDAGEKIIRSKVVQLEEGAVVEVTDCERGKCCVMNDEGLMANFPAGMLKILLPPRKIREVRSVAAYTGTAPGELSFQHGDSFDVLDSSGTWWYARNKDGVEGIISRNYMQRWPKTRTMELAIALADGIVEQGGKKTEFKKGDMCMGWETRNDVWDVDLGNEDWSDFGDMVKVPGRYFMFV